MIRRRIFIGGSLATPAFSAGTSWSQEASTIRVGIRAPVTSVDPHFFSYPPNIAVGHMIFDTLVRLDDQTRIRPGLAESWRTLDDKTWEFKLRPGVAFHNGEEFTAEDVAFSIARVPNVPNSPSSFTLYIRDIKSVEIVDRFTVRFHTDAPAPLVPVNLRNIFLLNKKTHAQATTADFNSGRVAIGTGPFKFVSYEGRERITLERNDNYWDKKPDWVRVDYRSVPSDAARTAALLAGDLDVIAEVPPGDLARLRTESNAGIGNAVSRSMVYIAVNFAHDANPPQITDADGRPLRENPLKDLRVRRALSLAIDRQAIADRVMDGMSLPTLQPSPPGVYGHEPELVVPAPDPELSRGLLAEAGYPNGFRIILSGPNDTIANGSRIIQAIGQMWTRVGIRTTIETQPAGILKARADRQELGAWLQTLTASGGEPSPIMVAGVATFDREAGYGTYNGGRYSNPEIDGLIRDALRELDDNKREDIFRKIARIIGRDLGIIPIHTPKNSWGMRKGIQLAPRADGYTRAQDAALSK